MEEAEDNLKKKARTAKQEMKLSDEDRHRFLSYLMPQLEPLRQACEHNWLTQAGLIALAGVHLYNNSAPIAIFGFSFPNQVLDVVFPLVLTYLMIRLGYLLNAYTFIRTGINTTLSKFTNRPEEFQDDNAERMLRSNSLVELLSLDYKWENRRKHNAILLILPLILSAIFALNHILSILCLERIAGYARGWAIVLGAVLGVPMTGCYVHFIFTPNKMGAKIISIATIALSILGYFLIHKIAYGWY